MANENEALLLKENELLTDIDDFDLDELESQLDEILNSDLDNLQISKEEQDKISDPNSLGTTVLNIVWDNFIGQVAIQSGNDFIKENNGLTLDLSNDAHIQTTENFEKGKIATHNTEIDYQKRYDDWQSNFLKDENGKIVTHKTRIPKRDNNGNPIKGENGEVVMKEVETLNENYRKPYDRERNKRGLTGNDEKGTAMDEVIPVAEIVRDPGANAHLSEEERIEFDLSEKNLNEIPKRWNSSKKDTPTDEWLDNPNSNGQTPQEIFDDLTDEEVKKLREKDKEAREEYEKVKKEGEKRSVETGKKSQRKELFRISGAVLRTVIIQLLMELGKRIVGHLISWLKTSNKKLKDLLIHIKQAVIEFGLNLKNHLVDLGKNIVSTIFSALGGVFGIIARTLNRVWGFLKQGFNSVKEVFQYLKDPSTKEKSAGIIGLQLGKIVVSGAAAAGGMVLSEAIEAVLAYYGGPVLNFEIPLLGSLASLLGVFLGGVISGIAGALALYHIDKMIANKLRGEASQQVLANANRVVSDNAVMLSIKERKMERAKKNAINNIENRSKEAEVMFTEMINEDMSDVYDKENQKRIKENSIKLDSI